MTEHNSNMSELTNTESAAKESQNHNEIVHDDNVPLVVPQEPKRKISDAQATIIAASLAAFMALISMIASFCSAKEIENLQIQGDKQIETLKATFGNEQYVRNLGINVYELQPKLLYDMRATETENDEKLLQMAADWADAIWNPESEKHMEIKEFHLALLTYIAYSDQTLALYSKGDDKNLEERCNEILRSARYIEFVLFNPHRDTLPQFSERMQSLKGDTENGKIPMMELADAITDVLRERLKSMLYEMSIENLKKMSTEEMIDILTEEVIEDFADVLTDELKNVLKDSLTNRLKEKLTSDLTAILKTKSDYELADNLIDKLTENLYWDLKGIFEEDHIKSLMDTLPPDLVDMLREKLVERLTENLKEYLESPLNINDFRRIALNVAASEDF